MSAPCIWEAGNHFQNWKKLNFIPEGLLMIINAATGMPGLLLHF